MLAAYWQKLCLDVLHKSKKGKRYKLDMDMLIQIYNTYIHLGPFTQSYLFCFGFESLQSKLMLNKSACQQVAHKVSVITRELLNVWMLKIIKVRKLKIMLATEIQINLYINTSD